MRQIGPQSIDPFPHEPEVGGADQDHGKAATEPRNEEFVHDVRWI